MYDLLTHTISQGLQAFLPVAVAWPWFRRAGDGHALAGVRWGVVAALPATPAAAYLFQSSTRQAVWEAALATLALLAGVWFARRVRRNVRQASPHQVVLAIATALLVTRQTMEIAVIAGAAFQLRALDPMLALAGGAAISLGAAALWATLAHRLSPAALRAGTIAFATVFVGQAVLYAFHESAEARLLPWSDLLHSATEPYGPDGVYGRYISLLLIVAPIAAAVNAAKGRMTPTETPSRLRPMRVFVRGAAVTALVIGAAGVGLMTRASDNGAPSSHGSPAAAPPPRDPVSIVATPHLLFRHTGVDPNYSRLSVAPLDPRGTADRAAAAFTCERVSYSAGRGICLAADRGVFTSFRAVLFNRDLQPTHTIPLTGSPSRTRVSPDGRVGAITVFVTGQTHGYAGAKFSTKTTILDMETGDELADLEQFTTWRNGARFKAADFNFWGVTFGRDANLFYATLRTSPGPSQAKTYLVRGDLALRKLTVLRDNVECPSLSPDNRLIAFKKRVGPEAAAWRVHILDVETLTDRPLSLETRSIDDQIEWLDDAHVLYAAPRATESASRDVWVAPIDNSAPPRVFIAEAESPIVVNR